MHYRLRRPLCGKKPRLWSAEWIVRRYVCHWNHAFASLSGVNVRRLLCLQPLQCALLPRVRTILEIRGCQSRKQPSRVWRPLRTLSVTEVAREDPPEQVLHLDCEHGYSPSAPPPVVPSLYATSFTRSGRGCNEIDPARQVRPAALAASRVPSSARSAVAE